MERYFARRCGDDVALYVGGFGEGPPTFIEPRLNGDFHADAAPTCPGPPSRTDWCRWTTCLRARRP